MFIFARGLNFGIEFRGGSEYRISGVSDTSSYEDKAQAAVAQAGISGNVVSTVIGGSTVRVQTEAAGDKNDPAKAALAQTFGVGVGNVSASLIGPSWGASVSQKAIQALIVFLILVALVMAIYFRTWKMAVAMFLCLVQFAVAGYGRGNAAAGRAAPRVWTSMAFSSFAVTIGCCVCQGIIPRQ